MSIEYSYARSAVHPHACGEHLPKQALHHKVHGSSPRLWGTQMYSTSGVPHIRFIPTPVGNTLQFLLDTNGMAVHPHACGEHVRNLQRNYQPSGSSPRLWGTPGTELTEEEKLRFIPTPVGNTAHCMEKYNGITVHPHACGEHIG